LRILRPNFLYVVQRRIVAEAFVFVKRKGGGETRCDRRKRGEFEIRDFEF